VKSKQSNGSSCASFFHLEFAILLLWPPRVVDRIVVA
jgi:hypothetical protein